MLGVHPMEFSVAGFHTHAKVKMAVLFISDLVELYSIWWSFQDLKRAIFGSFLKLFEQKLVFFGKLIFFNPYWYHSEK